MQDINLGNYANDGTGDDLRSAFEKVNSNFAILATTANNIANGFNLGSITLTNCNSSNNVVTTTSTAGLTAGMVVSITSGIGTFQTHTVILNVVNSTVFTVSLIPSINLLSAIVFATPAGSIFAQRNITNLEFKTITSTDHSITITNSINSVNLSAVATIANDPSPELTAPLQLNGHYISGGDIQTTTYGYNVPMLINLLGLLIKSSSVDFGSFAVPTVTDISNVDFGSFSSTVNNNVDFGNF